jgi:hypothetical protein
MEQPIEKIEIQAKSEIKLDENPSVSKEERIKGSLFGLAWVILSNF